MMKRAMIAALLLIAACSKDDGKTESGSLDPSLAELTKLRDKMCACKDKTCANAVNEQVSAFFKRDRERFESMPPDKKAQSAKLEDEQYQCWKKLK
jgi:hypothetical protein